MPFVSSTCFYKIKTNEIIPHVHFRTSVEQSAVVVCYDYICCGIDWFIVRRPNGGIKM